MYYFIEKSREDRSSSGLEGHGIISMEELEGFRKIIDEYRKEVDGVEDPEIDLKTFKEVTKDAKKEVKKLIKKNLKDELVQSKLASSTVSRVQKIH